MSAFRIFSSIRAQYQTVNNCGSVVEVSVRNIYECTREKQETKQQQQKPPFLIGSNESTQPFWRWPFDLEPEKLIK